MTKVGDFYVIEIAEEFTGVESGETKYRVKGFDNLVFDKKGIAKLEKLNIDSIMKHINLYVESAERDAFTKGFQKGIELDKQMNQQNFSITMDDNGVIRPNDEVEIEC